MDGPGWAWFSLLVIGFLAALRAGLRVRWGTALLSVGALLLFTGLALYYPLRFVETDAQLLPAVFGTSAALLLTGLVLVLRRDADGVGTGKWDRKAGATRPAWSRDRR